MSRHEAELWRVTGVQLNDWASLLGLSRTDGETDEEFRGRINSSMGVKYASIYTPNEPTKHSNKFIKIDPKTAKEDEPTSATRSLSVRDFINNYR